MYVASPKRSIVLSLTNLFLPARELIVKRRSLNGQIDRFLFEDAPTILERPHDDDRFSCNWGWVIGVSIARQLRVRYPESSVTLIEKVLTGHLRDAYPQTFL